MMLASLDDRIAKLEAEIAAEQVVITEAIAAHQIGNGYWQRRHDLQCRLRVATELRDAIAEAAAPEKLTGTAL